MTRFRIAAYMAALLAASSLRAQTIDRKTLSLDGARQVIAAAEAFAKQHNAPGGVIAVVDDGGNLMALERLDGTFSAGANISIGKARTAAMFKKPTRAFEEIIKNGRTSMVALHDFTPLQGGVPIEVDGQIVGAVGVSGAASAQQDEELAMAGAAAVAGAPAKRPAARAPALPAHFDRATVAAAFAAGSVLYDGGPAGAQVGGVDCSVNASRRDGPGKAEVHQREADVIYVLNGTATLVTGGTVTEPVEVSRDEVRGGTIAGGDARTISAGEVLVVPPGVPHWFKEVPSAFEYFVVKVRPQCALVDAAHAGG